MDHKALKMQNANNDSTKGLAMRVRVEIYYLTDSSQNFFL